MKYSKLVVHSKHLFNEAKKWISFTIKSIFSSFWPKITYFYMQVHLTPKAYSIRCPCNNPLYIVCNSGACALHCRVKLLSRLKSVQCQCWGQKEYFWAFWFSRFKRNSSWFYPVSLLIYMQERSIFAFYYIVKEPEEVLNEE